MKERNYLGNFKLFVVWLLFLLCSNTTAFGAFGDGIFYEDMYCYNIVSENEVEISNAFYPHLRMSYYYDPNDGLNMGFWHNREQVVVPEKVVHNGVTYTVVGVGNNAFDGCSMTETLELPKTIRYIGSEAFILCTHLRSINIPESVESIGSGAFHYCQELTEINIPKGCKGSLGSSTFSGCKKLKSIRIPGGVTSIGGYTFKECEALEELVFEDGSETLELGLGATDNRYINGVNHPLTGIFWDLGKLKRVYLGRNLHYDSSRTDYRPFYRVRGLEFGPTVTTIPPYLFYQTGVNIDEIPEGMESIGEYAFYGTLYDTKVLTLPSTLKSIGNQAFGNCQVAVYKCNATVPPTLSSSFYFYNKKNVVYVPNGCRDKYRGDEEWSRFTIVDRQDEEQVINVKTAGSLLSRLLAKGYQLDTSYRLKLSGTLNDDDWSVISAMEKLYEIDLQETDVTSIPQSAFANTPLIKVVLPKNLQSIGYRAFGNNLMTDDIVIPATCTSVGSFAFYGAMASDLKIEAPVCKIEDNAFSSMKRLKTLDLQGDNIVIGKSFWYNALKSVHIGKGVTIGNEAFESCYDMEEIILDEGVTTLGQGAFASNTNLREILIPSTIKEIGRGAFSSCDSLRKIVIREGCEIIGINAFYHCDSLREVEIPNTIRSIGDYAFYWSQALDSLVLPKSLESIGSYAFQYCECLTEISFPESLRSIGEGAFGQCHKLAKVEAPWLEPIKIKSGTFSQIDTKATLYVPIGTASKYKTATGWNEFAYFKEIAAMELSVAGNGSVIYSGHNLRNQVFLDNLAPYEPLEIRILPDEGYTIESFIVNDEDMTSELIDNAFYIDEVECGYNIRVKFNAGSDVPGIKPDIIVYDGNDRDFLVKGIEEALQSTTSANALFFIQKEIDDAPVNFIKEDKAKSIALTDAAPFYCPTDVEAETLTYTRTFNNTNWQPLYLPFNLSYEEWADKAKVAYVHNVHQYDDDDDGEVDRTIIEFLSKKKGEIEPNKPYVIKPLQTGEMTLTGTNKTLVATPETDGYADCRSTTTEYTIYGTYQGRTDLYENGYYAMAGGTFKLPSSASVTLSPFRTYMKIESRTGAGAMKKLPRVGIMVDGVIEGDATDIFDLEEDAEADAPAYNLQGVRVGNGYKGVVVKNGKKVVRR